jgi:hypothetical protein
MDLDEAAAQLYAVTPDDFMARRTALAAEAKASGDKALAKQITGLRKPTRSAWLVNLVARAEPERVAELRELGTALQQAQQQMAGDELRELSRQRRTLIDSLARRAAELGAEQGYDPPDSAVQEVSQTLQAALGDPAVADVVQAGRLHQAVTYGGFGPDDLGTTSVGDRAPSAWSTKRADNALPPASAEGSPRLSAMRERAYQEARAAAEEAEAAAEEATDHADELADQVESLRSQLREAETAEREAREAARAARKRSAELRREAAAAGQAAARAEQA